MATSQRACHGLRGLADVILGAIFLIGAATATAQDVPQLTVGRMTGEERPIIDGSS